MPTKTSARPPTQALERPRRALGQEHMPASVRSTGTVPAREHRLAGSYTFGASHPPLQYLPQSPHKKHTNVYTSWKLSTAGNDPSVSWTDQVRYIHVIEDSSALKGPDRWDAQLACFSKGEEWKKPVSGGCCVIPRRGRSGKDTAIVLEKTAAVARA